AHRGDRRRARVPRVGGRRRGAARAPARPGSARESAGAAMSGRERLAMAFLTLHPDAAARLLEGMPAGAARALLPRRDAPLAAAVVDKMLATDAARCLEQLPPDAAAAITAALGVPEAAAVIRHLPPAAREALLAAAAPQRAVALRLLLSYPPHTVGAWMDAT